MKGVFFVMAKTKKLKLLEKHQCQSIRDALKSIASKEEIFNVTDKIIEEMGWTDGGGMSPDAFKISKSDRRHLSYRIGWLAKEINHPRLFTEAFEDELRRFQLL